MKDLESNTPEMGKGTGYMIGALIGIIAAITAFIFTENIAIAIPLFAGLSIPIGISLEQKIQHKAKNEKSHKTIIMFALIGIGLLFFFSILYVLKFI